MLPSRIDEASSPRQRNRNVIRVACRKLFFDNDLAGHAVHVMKGAMIVVGALFRERDGDSCCSRRQLSISACWCGSVRGLRLKKPGVQERGGRIRLFAGGPKGLVARKGGASDCGSQRAVSRWRAEICRNRGNE